MLTDPIKSGTKHNITASSKIDHELNVNEQTPAKWCKLINSNDADALSFLNKIKVRNDHYLETDQVGAVQGVCATLDRALAGIKGEQAALFTLRLDDTVARFHALVPYLEQQAELQSTTPFMVFAHLTGDLITYCREIKKTLAEQGTLEHCSDENMLAALERVKAPSYAHEANLQRDDLNLAYEFELARVAFDVALFTEAPSETSRIDKFQELMQRSHTLLINLYFNPNQSIRETGDMKTLIEYTRAALENKEEDWYWGNF